MPRSPGVHRLIKNPYKGKFRWFIIKNLPDGKRKYIESLGYVSKTEAGKRLAEYNAGKKRISPSKITIEEAINDFEEYYQTKIGEEIKQGTFNIFIDLSKNVSKLIGHISLSELRRKDIENLKIALKKEHGYPNRTVNMHLTELKKVLEYAEDEEWIEGYPKIRRLSESGTEKITPTFSSSDLEKLIEGSQKYAHIFKKDLFLYISLMKYTAMRAQEACMLEWKDINFKEGWIFIRSENKHKPGGYIPLLIPLKKILKDTERADEFVSPFRKSSYAYRSLKRLATYTGIQVGPKMFRTSIATILAEEGVDLATIAALLRHSNIQTTNKSYVKLQIQAIGKAIEGKL